MARTYRIISHTVAANIHDPPPPYLGLDSKLGLGLRVGARSASTRRIVAIVIRRTPAFKPKQNFDVAPLQILTLDWQSIVVAMSSLTIEVNDAKLPEPLTPQQKKFVELCVECFQEVFVQIIRFDFYCRLYYFLGVPII